MPREVGEEGSSHLSTDGLEREPRIRNLKEEEKISMTAGWKSGCLKLDPVSRL